MFSLWRLTFVALLLPTVLLAQNNTYDDIVINLGQEEGHCPRISQRQENLYYFSKLEIIEGLLLIKK
jgi:hypothetical protein